jgi:hypothetical protein
MKSNWRNFLASSWWIGALAVSSLAGCLVHEQDHYDEVDVVDPHGYHHHGYYDERRDWHGGYYDDGHQFHDDPHDWHR